MTVKVVNGTVERLQLKAREWNVEITRTLETQSSVLALGTRNGTPVLLKIVRENGDEWRSGAVLKAFGGDGAVRVFEESDGAMLIERAVPGTALIEMAMAGHDDVATEILCGVMGRLWDPQRTAPAVTIQDWGVAFDRYLGTSDDRLQHDLVSRAKSMFEDLARTQTAPILLHGDLHHYNVLLDEKRGWLVIDPKGVIGEREYEIGAVMRNPMEDFEEFAEPSVIERRVRTFETALGLNADRMLRWSFAQGILSAIWLLEDGFPIPPDHSGLLLANSIQRMLDLR